LTRSLFTAVLAGGLCLALSASPPVAGAAAPHPGSLDRSFSGDGLVLAGFGSEPGRGGASRVALQPDRKAVVLVQTFRGYSLARYTGDGGFDPSFGEGGFRSGDLGAPLRSWAGAMAIQGDGKILVVGTRYDEEGFALARHLPDGALDRSFGDDGHLLVGGEPQVFGGAEALVLQPDGKILLLGRFERGAQTGVEVVRLSPGGGIDRSFGGDGFSVVPLDSSYVNLPFQSLALQAGKVTIAAEAKGGAHLIRLDPDGARDATLGGDGVAVITGLFERTSGLAVQPDGRTLLTGESGGVARFLADGSLDPSFGDGGLVLPQPRLPASAISLQPDGAILLAGQEEASGMSRDFMLARLTPEGTLDPSMGAGRGFVTTDIAAGSPDQAQDLALLPDGRVLLVGGTGILRLFDSVAAVRYGADGGLDPGFGGGGIVHTLARLPSRDAVSDLLVDRRGRVTATGRAAGKILVARYLKGGRPDPGFGSGGFVTAAVTGTLGERGESLTRYSDGRLLVGSGSGEGGALLRYLPHGAPDPSFGIDGIVRAAALDHVLDLVVLRSGAILAVGLGGECSVRLARFTRAGAPDSRFGGGDGLVAGPGIAGGCFPRKLSVAVQPSGRSLIAGDANGSFLLAYSASGKRVKRFAGVGPYKLWASLPDRIGALEVDRTGRIVVAGFFRRRELPRRLFGLVRLEPDGSVDRAFGEEGSVSTAIGPWAEIRDVRVGADGKIVVAGASGTCGGGSCFDVHVALARYDRNGTLDRGFGRRGVWVRRVGANSSLDALALGKGSMVAGGWTAVSGQDQQLLMVRVHR
jgi:uncharacterized delta-60 repeat protein